MITVLRALLALTLVAALAGCSAGSTAYSSPSADSITIGFSAAPANLDFTRTDGAAIPQALLDNVYQGLVHLDANGAIVPQLATSWTVSPDRRTYDFQLRPGVTFTDGEPFTADTVKFSIDRVRTDWTISLKSAMTVVDHVEAVDPRHARVVLKQPSNGWLFTMASRVGAMFAPNGVRDLATTPVGTGPYQLDRFNRGDSLVLKANPGYWGPKPAYGRVVLKYFQDPTALNNALLSNGIDVISSVQAPDSLAQFASDERFTTIQGTTTAEVVLSFNNAKAPLNDKRVRQALTFGIDRKALLDTAWAGKGLLIGSMVPPSDPWYEDLSTVYPYDPAKAKQLLADAGQQHLTLRLRIPNLPYAVDSAQVIRSQLAAIGVTVSIEELDFPAVWLKQVFTGHDFDMSIVAHVEARDIVTFGNPKYYWGYSNPTVTQLLAEADTGTPEQQIADMKQVARTINADAAADWLFLLPNLIVAKKGITGLPPNQVGEAFDLSALGRA
ncbi:peptide/nickel transport system substrate-binding protein [Kutzneria kofuensis]|uniref:Peptide/nickel transport system substrate-binding protein n=1 Tax=Kutzneria kofuensis TaxID=103725 RepID=A0A7W9NJ07_9PSEU|nr:peptide/nickel transport system substrate-binding protein [Kutzneria kofuensis]